MCQTGHLHQGLEYVVNRHEMRTLGRVGQPLSGGTYRPRRRLRAPRWLVLALGVSMVALVWVGVTANRQIVPPSVAAPLASDVPARRTADARASRSNEREAATFATVSGLALSLPHAHPTAIAFHEASQVEALALVPTGHLVSNDNATRFTPPRDTAGPDYRVLSSRGRPRPPTSAVDVVVPGGGTIVSPVDGTVTSVTEYPLYGRVHDWRVEITPAARPDLTVVLIHLLQPSIDVGSSVTAGQTVIGEARLLPFDSHVDYAVGAKRPHVHLEVKPSVAAGPIDPNEPARPAGEQADF